jgi:hypothetical protein
MRKMLKNKLKCCGLCKPHKRGMSMRWKIKDLDRMIQAEKEITDYFGIPIHYPTPDEVYEFCQKHPEKFQNI